jgi:UPF0271 protein
VTGSRREQEWKGIEVLLEVGSLANPGWGQPWNREGSTVTAREPERGQPCNRVLLTAKRARISITHDHTVDPRDPGNPRNPSLELNADVGELAGAAGREADRAILSAVCAASIACGAHAGDDETMRLTLAACLELGVAAGAHPGYPDREGFGRRRGTLTPAEIRASVASQLRSIRAHAEGLGVPLRRVKAHGALYNESALDRDVANALLAGVDDVLPGVTLLVLAASPVVVWAREAGFSVLEEGFADRAYRADGTLVPRSEPGALLATDDEVIVRAVRIARDGRVESVDGKVFDLVVDTLCLHGDTPGAGERARRLREALSRAGVEVCARG